MTRYSFIRVTRSFVFPSLFNHFLGCSPTALNAQNQKMLGNKETHVYARDTRIQIDAKIQRRTDVGTTSVAYLNLVIQICSTFFLLPSLESLSCFSFISLFSSFFFLFFFVHAYAYYPLHIFFYFSGFSILLCRLVSPSRDFDNAFEPTQFFLSPPFSIKLCCSR